MKFDPEEFVRQGVDLNVEEENDTFFKNYTEEVLNDILSKKPVTQSINKQFLKTRNKEGSMMVNKTKSMMASFMGNEMRSHQRNSSQ